MIIFIDDAAVAVTGATWNPADKNASITLTNSNKTCTNSTGSGVLGLVRANITKTTGKFYWEIVDTESSDQDGNARIMGIGIANTSASVNEELGGNANGWGIFGPGGPVAEAMIYHNNSIQSSNSAFRFVEGDVLMFAFDIDAGKLWYGKNGTWVLSGDPEAGTNATISGIAAGTWAPACEPFAALDRAQMTIRQPNEHTQYALTTFQNGWY